MTSEEKAQKARDILNSNPSGDDLQIALGLVNEAVADNNATALHVLAQLRYRGVGMEKDDKEAFALCRKAIDGGCERAKLMMAMLYVEGKVVEQDLQKARAYIEEMMAKDDDEAFWAMGCYVQNGTFPEIDELQGFAYLEKAVALGHKIAMGRLAQSYASLCETEKADYWFDKAEAAGVEGIEAERARWKAEDEDTYDQRLQQAVQFYFSKEKYDKGFRLLERDTAAGNMIAKYQLAYYSISCVGEEAYGHDIQRAVDLYGELSAEGGAHADFMLGIIYSENEEALDFDKGMAYMRKAAEDGHPEAQYKLAWRYCSGDGVAEDKAEGMRYMEAAAGQGQGDALYLLASCHLQDNEIEAGNWEHNPGYGQDTEKGLDYLRRGAEADNFAALASLARCYHKGKYVEQDNNKAFELLKRSCSINQHPDNVTLLADFHHDGIGTPQDYETAAKLYQFAADNGNVTALGKLPMMYSEGQGVEKDEEKANELWQRYVETMEWRWFGKIPLQQLLAIVSATEDELQGTPFSLPDAMNQLGDRYANGDEVEPDEEKAAEWWEKASQRGNARAMYSLGQYHALKDGMPSALEYLERSASAGYLPAYFSMGAYYVENGKDEAEKDKGLAHLTTAAIGGNTDALHYLTCMYHDGTFGDKDYDKARYWLNKYLATDDSRAHFLLATCLYHGDMYEQDYAKALEHVTIAVKDGCHDATELYMHMRWWGNHCEQDREEVVSTYRERANHRDAQAKYQLYLLYTDESFDGRSQETAIDWLQKAAEQGNADALCELARLYANGEGVGRDAQKALDLYEQAMERGSMPAVYGKAHILIYGVEGETAADCDKAMELLRPFTENGDATACYLMASAYNSKCSEKNAYSWELAAEAAQYMEKAAEGGFVEAMHLIGLWYCVGRGVFVDTDKAKMWLGKYEENDEDSEETERLSNLSDEAFLKSASDTMIYYWQEIVEANKEKITDWQEYVDSEDNIHFASLTFNAAQLGEANAVSLLGYKGLEILKTSPDDAKRYIKMCAEQGLCYFAEQAGKTLMEEGLDNEEAVTAAVEYFYMGLEQGHIGCALQLGLLFTTEGADKKAEQVGSQYLQQICESEGDDWEDERQQAKARLEEMEHRPKTFIGRLVRRLHK